MSPRHRASRYTRPGTAGQPRPPPQQLFCASGTFRLVFCCYINFSGGQTQPVKPPPMLVGERDPALPQPARSFSSGGALRLLQSHVAPAKDPLPCARGRSRAQNRCGQQRGDNPSSGKGFPLIPGPAALSRGFPAGEEMLPGWGSKYPLVCPRAAPLPSALPVLATSGGLGGSCWEVPVSPAPLSPRGLWLWRWVWQRGLLAPSTGSPSSAGPASRKRLRAGQARDPGAFASVEF